MFQSRQGDLFFEEVAAPPTAAKKRETPVLAYGEITGHCHQIKNFEGVALLEDNDAIYMHGTNDIFVGHDEHADVACPKDKWIKVVRQREYDPLAAELERKVAD
jgi:hypothetical protein